MSRSAVPEELDLRFSEGSHDVAVCPGLLLTDAIITVELPIDVRGA